MATLTLVLAVGGVLGCGAGPSADEVGAAVPVVAAERRTLEVRAEAAGLLEPILLVEVKSKASGEVLALHVETGDRVERDELLVEIDPRDVRNQLAQAQADLAVAEATMSTAEAQYERANELRKASVIAEQELEAAALERANARAQLVKAETNLQLAQERMGDVTIQAPIRGTILSKTIEIGQIIASAGSDVSGGTTLFVMADLSEMQVRTMVDETDVGRIQPGQTAQVAVEAYPGRTFVGQVLKIEPQAVVEENVTMFPVLIRLDNDQRLLKPGMNSEVEIEITRRENVVAVPSAAVALMDNAAEVALALGLDDPSLGGARGGRRGPGGGTAAAETGAAPAEQAVALADNGAAAAVDHANDNGAGSGDGASADDGTRPADNGGSTMSHADMSGADPTAVPARRAAGMVFVAGPNGPEPRRVVLGMSDWEYTEIVDGLEPGEQVYIVSVALLQQQQREFTERVSERAGGVLPGS